MGKGDGGGPLQVPRDLTGCAVWTPPGVSGEGSRRVTSWGFCFGKMILFFFFVWGAGEVGQALERVIR